MPKSIVLRSVPGGTITSIGLARYPAVITDEDRRLFGIGEDHSPFAVSDSKVVPATLSAAEAEVFEWLVDRFSDVSGIDSGKAAEIAHELVTEWNVGAVHG